MPLFNIQALRTQINLWHIYTMFVVKSYESIIFTKKLQKLKETKELFIKFTKKAKKREQVNIKKKLNNDRLDLILLDKKLFLVLHNV